jgi:hypothetical protein
MQTWLGVHHGRVNDRLVRLVAARGAPRVRASWSAVATWLDKSCSFATAWHVVQDFRLLRGVPGTDGR